jgi:hypothetical protein
MQTCKGCTSCYRNKHLRRFLKDALFLLYVPHRFAQQNFQHLPQLKSHTMAETHKLQASSLFSVKDYVCLVTGGGTGIGLMAAQALAANGTSALNSLALTYRN